MKFEVKADMAAVESMLGDLSGKAGAVIARASNSAAGTAKKVMQQETAARYRVKSTDVAKTIKVGKASAREKKPFAVIRSTGKHLGLEDFKVSPFRAVEFKGNPGRKRRSPGVYKAAVKRGQGLKKLGKEAFVATMGNGHTGIFLRTGRTTAKGNAKRRTKRTNSGIIEALYGPSVPQMIQNRDVMGKVEKETGEMMQKRLIHEVDAVVKKYAD